MPFYLFDKLPPHFFFFEGVGLDVGIGKEEDEYLVESGEALTLVDIGVFFSAWRSRGGLGLGMSHSPLRPASARHFFPFLVFLSSSSSSPYPSSKTRTAIEAYPPPPVTSRLAIIVVVVASVISAPCGTFCRRGESHSLLSLPCYLLSYAKAIGDLTEIVCPHCSLQCRWFL